MNETDKTIDKHLGLHEQVSVIKLVDGYMADLSPKGWPLDVGIWGRGGSPTEALEALGGHLDRLSDMIERKASKLRGE